MRRKVLAVVTALVATAFAAEALAADNAMYGGAGVSVTTSNSAMDFRGAESDARSEYERQIRSVVSKGKKKKTLKKFKMTAKMRKAFATAKKKVLKAIKTGRPKYVKVADGLKNRYEVEQVTGIFQAWAFGYVNLGGAYDGKSGKLKAYVVNTTEFREKVKASTSGKKKVKAWAKSVVKKEIGNPKKVKPEKKVAAIVSALCKEFDPAVEDDGDSLPIGLKSKRLNCYGYSRAFVELCSAAGLEAKIVNGWSDKAADEPHAWNAVKIGKKWYYLDACWDDQDDDGNSTTYPHKTGKSFLFSSSPTLGLSGRVADCMSD